MKNKHLLVLVIILTANFIFSIQLAQAMTKKVWHCTYLHAEDDEPEKVYEMRQILAHACPPPPPIYPEHVTDGYTLVGGSSSGSWQLMMGETHDNRDCKIRGIYQVQLTFQ